MNTRSILTSTAALAALALAACSSPDSGAEVETAPVADSSPAATETTEDAPDSEDQPPEADPENSERTDWAYDDERGWYEYEVDPGPHAEQRSVEPCPYHEEVSAVGGDRAEQFDKAVALGCEVGIHGNVDFTQPLDPAEDGTGVYSITSPEHALSVAEMCDQGYMSNEACKSEEFAP